MKRVRGTRDDDEFFDDDDDDDFFCEELSFDADQIENFSIDKLKKHLKSVKRDAIIPALRGLSREERHFELCRMLCNCPDVKKGNYSKTYNTTYVGSVETKWNTERRKTS